MVGKRKLRLELRREYVYPRLGLHYKLVILAGTVAPIASAGCGAGMIERHGLLFHAKAISYRKAEQEEQRHA